VRIHISIARQELTLFDDDGRELSRYPVSTAERGVHPVGLRRDDRAGRALPDSDHDRVHGGGGS